MKSDKIIIELKDLSKVYQMSEENIVKALDPIHCCNLYSHSSRIPSKVLQALKPYLAVAQ